MANGVPDGVSLEPVNTGALEHRLYTADELHGVSMTKMDAPPNSVYDQDNSRVVSLPQTLSPTETGFVIKRDVDQVKNFFGMQEVGGFEALGKGVASFFASQPQVAGYLMENQAEVGAIQQGKTLAGTMYPDREPTFSDMFKNMFNQPNTILADIFGAKEMGEKADILIERNKKYMADAGLERPEQGGISGILYDIGQGTSSTLASVGMAALTRNPDVAAVYFGAMQKASVYQEARGAGIDPLAANDISNVAGMIEGGLEFVGLDHFMKALKGNSFVKKFINGAVIEGVQEASQQTGEELTTQLSGVRSNKPLAETVSDILYNGFLGAAVGGASSAAVGAFVKDKAQKSGLDQQTAEKLGDYAAKNVDAAKQNMGEFIDKEVAPIARDDKSAQEFITLMQKFGNDQSIVERDSLNPEQRTVFDQYVEMFNNAKVDKKGVSEVEKTFFDMASKAGVEKDQATAGAKLVGARADAASRALGVSPMEWYVSKNIDIKVHNKGEKASIEQMLGDEIRFQDNAPNGKKIYWHGSVSGDLRGGASGLHLGTKQAAKEALESRIGVPAQGEWDGTREYGKTLLAGQKRLREIEKNEKRYVLTGKNASAPEEDYYPADGDLKYPNGDKVPMDVKPNIQGFTLKGKMTNSPQNAHPDFKANGYMSAAIKKGNAKSGYFYKNEAEDYGSISAVVPNGSHLDALDVLNQGEKNPKGSVTFGKDGSNLIQLFEGRDASTLFHELGHIFLRDMRDVARGTDRARVKADYKAVQKFLNTKGNRLSVAQEEKWARGFEAYLREGKAPTPELQGVFDRFKKWLESIYKSVKDLNVNLSPEIRQVFDRMLGGDFVQAETLNQDVAERSIEDDYEAVANTPPKSTLLEDTAAIFSHTSDLAADAFVPVSTRLGNIDQKLKHAVRKFLFQTGLYSHEDRVEIKPFIEKVSNDFEEGDYRVFDLALKNRDTVKADFLIDKYGLQEEWAAVRRVLDGIYNEASDVGLDLNYIEQYFPRKVRRGMAAEYIATMQQNEHWSEIELAMREVDPHGTFTAEEQADFVNNYLRGFTTSRINLARPSFTKERTVDYITPQLNKFYQDSMPTLMEYIGALRHGIEARKLFGKSEEDTDENIGAYVLGLVRAEIISADQEMELKKLLKAVVEPTGTKGAVSWAKNASYIYLMGNPISAISQIQDLAFSLHKNGYYRTVKSLIKSLTGNQALKKEDIGIENILQEFEDNSRASDFVRATFKAVGLEFMDNVGKEVYMDAAYERLKAASAKNDQAFNAQMETIFGEEAEQVKRDLASGTLSENVRYLIFSEISDVQPISLAEMPVAYLRGGNGRIFYMLKSYTIKQLDIYRREIFANIASGEISKVATGLKNLIGLSASLMVMGMGSDALKDLLLGRPIDIDDLITDNMLKLMGFTKYQIYKAKDEGIASAVLRTLFMPPIFAPIDDLGKDIMKTAQGKQKLKDAAILGHIPVVGNFYYWWWGGGRTKINKKKGKS